MTTAGILIIVYIAVNTLCIPCVLHKRVVEYTPVSATIQLILYGLILWAVVHGTTT